MYSNTKTEEKTSQTAANNSTLDMSRMKDSGSCSLSGLESLPNNFNKH